MVVVIGRCFVGSIERQLGGLRPCAIDATNGSDASDTKSPPFIVSSTQTSTFLNTGKKVSLQTAKQSTNFRNHSVAIRALRDPHKQCVVDRLRDTLDFDPILAHLSKCLFHGTFHVASLVWITASSSNNFFALEGRELSPNASEFLLHFQRKKVSAPFKKPKSMYTRAAH